jgi:hypothetical protein
VCSSDLSGVLSEVISLENIGPSLGITQNDGHSFKRAVNFTGSAHDGVWAGIYERDDLARWDQQGVVEQVQVKDPFTSDWIDMRLAVDNSGSDGEVTFNNHPFRHWSFEYDMSDQPEGDYTFEFRSFDGIDYSPIMTRTIRLNTEPPTVWVDGPADGTIISDGVVHFTGRASDAYNGIFGSDIQRIWFEVNGPELDGGGFYYNLFHKPGGMTWSADWTVGHLPTGSYQVSVWANDSAFCTFEIDECTPTVLNLQIDNTNAIPVVQLLSPADGLTITASEETMITGVARDTDGTVTLVEIVILDPQAGFLELPEGPHSIVTDIQPNGAWQATWDTTFLVHNYHYIVQARSFDGFQFSEAAEVDITIDNPPNQDNTRPVFDSTDWPDEVTIFCEEVSAASSRCGEHGYQFDLTPFFSDPDNDDLRYYVLDDIDKFEDDKYPDVISVSTDGVASYNPSLSMSFYTPVLAEWTLENVVFFAVDTAGSRVYSISIDFNVVAVTFSSKCAGVWEDSNNSILIEGCPDEISQAQTIVYQGTGRPSVTIEARTGVGNHLGRTVVDEDGTWSMDIPGNRLDKGDNEIRFEYGNVMQPMNSDSQLTVSGGDEDGGGLLMTILFVLFALTAVAVLGGVFVFFFVEFEEIEDDPEEPEVEVDAYAWAKDRQEAADIGASAGAAAVTAVEPAAQPVVAQEEPAVAGYPGWQWDAEQNKWVPENP